MKREILNINGKNISIAVWDDTENAKGVVQLSHGMAEHIQRYDDFARFLCGNGYIVIGDDHRGHGYTDPDKLGVASGDIFEDKVADLRYITSYASKTYGLPVILMGHSYGSFLTQRYLTYGFDGIKAAILCGSAKQGGLILKVGKSLSRKKCKNEADEPGATFAKMTFEKYDNDFGEGKNSWLSLSKENVQKFNADPLCGFTCSNGFYYSFFTGIDNANKFLRQGDGFKLLIVSGSEDPVGGYCKYVEKLNRMYLKAGYDTTLHLYENMRHEILNEEGKQIVYDDILAFLDENI